MSSRAAVSTELRRMWRTCPEGLTDEEAMAILCSSNGSDGGECSEDIFSEIFRRYHSRVTSWCFRLTRNRTRALDLAQEVLFKAYRHRDSFRGDARFSTWLY